MSRPRIPLPFRVHYVDGTKLTVTATSAADARRQATDSHPGIITKVKIVKEAAQ